MSTVYATATRDRFFLVPDDATLPPGDLEIRSLLGAAARVDPDGVKQYEVPEEVAKREVMERMAAMKAVATELNEFAARLTAVNRQLGASPAEARERVETVLAALGVSYADLEKDPVATVKLAAERLKTLASDRLKAIAKKA